MKKKSSKNKKEIWLKYLLNNACYQYKPLEIYWKVQNRSYSCRIRVLISLPICPVLMYSSSSEQPDLRSQQKCPSSDLVQSKSVQWLGPALVWKIGCTFKIPSRKKSSDYQPTAEKLNSNFLHWLKAGVPLRIWAKEDHHTNGGSHILCCKI